MNAPNDQLHSEVEARRIQIAREMFLDTADMNYTGARSAFLECRDYDFWWLSLHAVEKYLKAALLVNGASIKGASHDIEELLHRLKLLDRRLQPPPFIRPKIAGRPRIFELADDGFIRNLNVIGSATNRYAAYSYVISPVDLHRVDHLVFWARRHARPLRQKLAGRDLDWIAELYGSPQVWRHHYGAPLEKLVDSPKGMSARRALVKANVAFFPDHRHRPIPRRALAHNGILFRHIQMFKDSSPGEDRHRVAKDVLLWALQEIPLPKNEVRHIQKILAEGEGL